MTDKQIIGLMCSVLLPPLGAIIAKASGLQIVINILLTVFGFWILGILHAAYLVMSSKELQNK